MMKIVGRSYLTLTLKPVLDEVNLTIASGIEQPHDLARPVELKISYRFS